MMPEWAISMTERTSHGFWTTWGNYRICVLTIHFNFQTKWHAPQVNYDSSSNVRLVWILRKSDPLIAFLTPTSPHIPSPLEHENNMCRKEARAEIRVTVHEAERARVREEERARASLRLESSFPRALITCIKWIYLNDFFKKHSQELIIKT